MLSAQLLPLISWLSVLNYKISNKFDIISWRYQTSDLGKFATIFLLKSLQAELAIS